MDDRTQKAIEAGQPMVILHLDKDKKVVSEERYNLENILISQWQMDQLSRTLLETCKEFYSDPRKCEKI